MLAAYVNNGTASNVPEHVESAVRSRDGATYDAYEEDMAEVVFFFNRQGCARYRKCELANQSQYITSLSKEPSRVSLVRVSAVSVSKDTKDT